jgi:hypothetical protein
VRLCIRKKKNMSALSEHRRRCRVCQVAHSACAVRADARRAGDVRIGGSSGSHLVCSRRIQARATVEHWGKSGVEMAVIGALFALVVCTVGLFFQALTVF